MEDFTQDFNSVIDIIKQGATLEHRYVPVDYLLHACGYDRKCRSCKDRCLKSKLTEKYDSSLLPVTVEQNRPIIIISPPPLERQPGSNFVDKTIIPNKL